MKWLVLWFKGGKWVVLVVRALPQAGNALPRMCFINSFALWSAPAAFLFLCLGTYFFAPSLVNSLSVTLLNHCLPFLMHLRSPLPTRWFILRILRRTFGWLGTQPTKRSTQNSQPTKRSTQKTRNKSTLGQRRTWMHQNREDSGSEGLQREITMFKLGWTEDSGNNSPKLSA